MNTKSFLPLILLMLLSSTAFSQPGLKKSAEAGVVTWNIRYNNPGDGVNAWPNRKDRVITFLKKVNPQIFCMQEVLISQMNDLSKGLPQYSWFGVGRDDGREAGEYVPVFFKKSQFRQIQGDHFWLAEAPAKPGKLGWDAACTRMVTWVSLVDRYSKDTLFVFNTHFDHIGVKARLESAKMLVHAVDSLCPRQTVIITGDFNTSDKDAPYSVITGAGFLDSRVESITYPAGPEYTFTGFDIKGKPGERIDFIYLRNAKPVQSYVVREDSSNGNYLSDHLPVIIKF